MVTMARSIRAKKKKIQAGTGKNFDFLLSMGVAAFGGNAIPLSDTVNGQNKNESTGKNDTGTANRRKATARKRMLPHSKKNSMTASVPTACK